MRAKKLKGQKGRGIGQHEKKVMVSMRMPRRLIGKVKTIAKRNGVAYQALIREWIAEKAKIEVK
jgi:predicted DNA binding CopG/RHH family protein